MHVDMEALTKECKRAFSQVTEAQELDKHTSFFDEDGVLILDIFRDFELSKTTLLFYETGNQYSIEGIYNPEGGE